MGFYESNVTLSVHKNLLTAIASFLNTSSSLFPFSFVSSSMQFAWSILDEFSETTGDIPTQISLWISSSHKQGADDLEGVDDIGNRFVSLIWCCRLEFSCFSSSIVSLVDFKWWWSLCVSWWWSSSLSSITTFSSSSCRIRSYYNTKYNVCSCIYIL